MSFRRYRRNPSKKMARAKICRVGGQLTTKRRKALRAESFGLPSKRAYPIPDLSHARNAKARAAQQYKAGRLSKRELDQVKRRADAVIKSCSKTTGNPSATYELTDADGRTWRWSRAELEDTLLESAAWDSDATRRRVASLKVGQQMRRGKEVLRRINPSARKTEKNVSKKKMTAAQKRGLKKARLVRKYMAQGMTKSGARMRADHEMGAKRAAAPIARKPRKTKASASASAGLARRKKKAKKKASKRKATKKKTAERKVTKRKATKKKTAKRKVTKRAAKPAKRKTTTRKAKKKAAKKDVCFSLPASMTKAQVEKVAKKVAAEIKRKGKAKSSRRVSITQILESAGCRLQAGRPGRSARKCAKPSMSRKKAAGVVAAARKSYKGKALKPGGTKNARKWADKHMRRVIANFSNVGSELL